MPSVDLILPVFNERDQVPAVVRQLTEWIGQRPDVHAIFVDDASSDGTPEAIEGALRASGAPRCRVERFPRNRGKGAVIRDAARASAAEIICFTDGDLAYPLGHVDQLVEGLAHADVVIGSRALAEAPQRNISFKRKLMGGAFNRAVRLLLGLPHGDTQAGLKGFRRDAARRIFGASKVDDFAFDVEVLYLARLEGLSVREIPAVVAPSHSYHGTSMNLLLDPWRMLRSVLRVRHLHRKRPRAAPAAAP